MNTEKLQRALLLAGARASIEGTAVYVEISGERLSLSTYCPPRGATALRVAPNGTIEEWPSRKARGHVIDLISSI